MFVKRFDRIALENNPLHQQMVRIPKENAEDSKETRRKRQAELERIVQSLREQFGLRNLHNLKAKHVTYLVGEIRAADTGSGNAANRLAHLHWLLEKLEKPGLLGKRNEDLGIKTRARNVRQGKVVSPEKLAQVMSKLGDAKSRALVMLARHFGMRFEEASLFRPHYDVDAGGMVWIKRGSKGGRPRFIPVVTEEQRTILTQVKTLVADKFGCLVDQNVSYKTWRDRKYKEFRAAGLSRKAETVFHDLRRTYAASETARLVEKGHTADETAKIVSKRLGHNRVDILRAYIVLA